VWARIQRLRGVIPRGGPMFVRNRDHGQGAPPDRAIRPVRGRRGCLRGASPCLAAGIAQPVVVQIGQHVVQVGSPGVGRRDPEVASYRLSLRDSLPSLGRLVALLRWLDHASASPFHPLASFCCFRLLFAVFSRHLCVSHSAWGLGCAWRPAQSSPRVLPTAWESSHCATPINSRRVSDTPRLLFATPAAAF
jgi:hypothetical protein